ncbi:MAG: mannose-1-phosphate guanylyltransferase/mannose-6-phosphate isomerase [Gammaproteobacteria bacterium]|nr:MAG: mannose-1-phosphate guanylyltransferase/mannose-6-phosphate isomerase [Gammaproteobacteria bacterium]
MILPVVMAGGVGSRLWPLSRQHFPKQFLSIASSNTMMQDTLLRLGNIEHTAPLFICNEDHRFIVAEQLREDRVSSTGIILEPSGRNTAPAIALAALKALDGGDDPVLLVLAADHVIKDVPAFETSLRQAMAPAEKGKLVTFGILPSKPETGYGYIKKSALQPEFGENVYSIWQFVEKPDVYAAQDYVDSGDYLWNSGMFMFKASRYLAELQKYRPDIYDACEQAMLGAQTDADFIRPSKVHFEACPEDSIDYAVMEKTEDAVVVPVDCGWSDVGSWSSLWDIAEKDESGNVLNGEVMTEGTTNSYIKSESKLIATVGLDNVVIVESDDAILVADKDKVQDVKKIFNRLKAKNRSEAFVHRKVYRPWGYFDSIDNGERFQVKRIFVDPGAQLSLQMHHHRAEHWVVVKGTALVTRGDETFLVTENQSTYIPIGTQHRLANPGSIPLEMIEVQSGSYLGEDDIVRLDDIYGREE